MTTKRFCDFCGQEIPSDRSHGGDYNSKVTLRRTGSHQQGEAADV